MKENTKESERKSYSIKTFLILLSFIILMVIGCVLYSSVKSRTDIKDNVARIQDSTIEIDSVEEWNYWAKDIADNEDNSWTEIGYGSIRTFKLISDLDFSGKTFIPLGAKISGTEFQGCTGFFHILEGDNHVIKNITLTINSSTGGHPHLGVVSILRQGSEVKNLHVKNFTINYNYDDMGLMGGICGTIDTTDDATNRYTDGKACKIEYCFVENFKVVLGDNAKVGSIDGNHIGAVYADYVYTDTYCMGFIKGSLELRFISVYGFNVINPDKAYAIGLLEPCNAEYVRFQWRFDGYITMDNISAKYEADLKGRYLTNNKRENVTKSYYIWRAYKEDDGMNASTKTGPDVNTVWYYDADYRGGYAVLRKFIDWQKISFKTQRPQGVDFDCGTAPADIFIPSDLSSKNTYLKDYGAVNGITIFKIGCNVTDIKFGYLVKEWTWFPSYNYFVIKFEREKVKFKFNKPTSATINYMLSNAELDKEYDVYLDTQMNVVKTEYKNSAITNKEPNFECVPCSEISVSIEDVAGNVRKVTYYVAEDYVLISNVETMIIKEKFDGGVFVALKKSYNLVLK